MCYFFLACLFVVAVVVVVIISLFTSVYLSICQIISSSSRRRVCLFVFIPVCHRVLFVLSLSK